MTNFRNKNIILKVRLKTSESRIYVKARLKTSESR